MSDRGLSDKERALIESARREAAAKRDRAAGGSAPAGARKPPTAVPKHTAARASAGAAQAAPRSSTRKAQPARALDEGPRTVIGWDHPAAQGRAAPASADKWSQIAALMEQEREEGRARRSRAQRGVALFLLILFILVAFVGARILTS